MRIDELYPYWEDVHQELIERIEFLSEDAIDARPHGGAMSIRQLVLQFAESERFFVAHLAGGFAYERPSPSAYVDGRSLVDLLTATREVSARVLEPLSAAGLRAVRSVPPDTESNRPETNMPIAWLFWHTMELEIGCLARVTLRLMDEKKKTPGRWE